MGLRCLLGHDFDEPELQREREEDGDEVVTTVTEVKTCARCGETQIVSENTEVTTVEQLTDEATGEAAGRQGGPEADAAASGAGGAESFGAAVGGGDAGTDTDAPEGDGDDAVLIDDGADGAADGPEQAAEATDAVDGDGAELLDKGAPEASTTAAPGGEYDEYPGAESGAAQTGGEQGVDEGTEPNDERDAETDDGVILDETGESGGDRDRGAWPEVEGDESPGSEPAPWPEQEGDDEGYSAEVGGGESGDVEFGGGLTPEAAAGEEADDAEYVEAPERDSVAGAEAVEAGAAETEDGDGDGPVDVGITRGESPDVGPSTADATTEYHCPECGMTRDAAGSSMRAGDICPECKRGYVAERPIGD